jgi:hypothetical protein
MLYIKEMKIITRKYGKILSAISLLIYLFFLSSGSFHIHHLNYFTDAVFSANAYNAQAGDSQNCIFNQINRPSYFYNFTQQFSLHNQIDHFVTQFLDYNVFSSNTIFSVNHLRAPPTLS